MAFVRRVNYSFIQPYIKKLEEFLGKNGRAFNSFGEASKPTDESTHYFLEDAALSSLFAGFEVEIRVLTSAKIVEIIPLKAEDRSGAIIYLARRGSAPRPTVSPTHVRLPKLSHLITLCPEDFFKVFQLVAGAQTTSSKDALTLNFAAAQLSTLEGSTIEHFFTPLKKNYRLNPDYSDEKWTDRDIIKRIAKMPPSREYQFMAMQYLTAMQNTDLLYFPIETSIDLELDWEQVSDDYCVPPSVR